jgi:L-ribulose-5-phosphate 4-epimerase
VSSIEAAREQLVALHAELPRNGLVVRLRDPDVVLIKPSGVGYEELTAEKIVVVDLDGNILEGELAPSSDTATHLYVYRAMGDVGGIVHTHSPYATAWAACNRPIPCVVTAMADEFGGEIPIGPFARIGGEEIGVGVVATLEGHRSPAVLMRNHGVFTIGASARDAVKAAIMCEDVARTVLLAHTLGQPLELAQADVDALYDRYQNVYGQPPPGAETSRRSQ